MKMKILIWLIAVAICVVASSPEGHMPIAVAQNTSETYAITNARIFTVTGPVIERGTVVIQNGKIAAVGASVSVPPGAKVTLATSVPSPLSGK